MHRNQVPQRVLQHEIGEKKGIGVTHLDPKVIWGYSWGLGLFAKFFCFRKIINSRNIQWWWIRLKQQTNLWTSCKNPAVLSQVWKWNETVWSLRQNLLPKHFLSCLLLWILETNKRNGWNSSGDLMKSWAFRSVFRIDSDWSNEPGYNAYLKLKLTSMFFRVSTYNTPK